MGFLRQNRGRTNDPACDNDRDFLHAPPPCLKISLRAIAVIRQTQASAAQAYVTKLRSGLVSRCGSPLKLIKLCRRGVAANSVRALLRIRRFNSTAAAGGALTVAATTAATGPPQLPLSTSPSP